MTTNCRLEPDSYYPKVLCGSEVQKGGAKWCLGPHELTSHFGVSQGWAFMGKDQLPSSQGHLRIHLVGGYPHFC